MASLKAIVLAAVLFFSTLAPIYAGIHPRLTFSQSRRQDRIVRTTRCFG